MPPKKTSANSRTKGSTLGEPTKPSKRMAIKPNLPAPARTTSSLKKSPGEIRRLKAHLQAATSRVEQAEASLILLRLKPQTEFEDAHVTWFKSEENNLQGKDKFRPPKGSVIIYPRLANIWFLCKPNTLTMVAPEFWVPAKGEDVHEYDLYASNAYKDLWQLDTKFLVARVKSPRVDQFPFYGCLLNNTVFPSTDDENVFYVVQNPDRSYAPYWEYALALWELKAAQGTGQPLVRWVDIDFSKPRPWFCNKWAFTIMRLEAGLPTDIPGDPMKLAMLGACRDPPYNRAPVSEEEWAKLPGAVGDDEANMSDAVSLPDDIEDGRPTSSTWDPATRLAAPVRHEGGEGSGEEVGEEVEAPMELEAGEQSEVPPPEIEMEESSQAQHQVEEALFPPSPAESRASPAPTSPSQPSPLGQVQQISGTQPDPPAAADQSPSAAASSPPPTQAAPSTARNFFLPPPAPGAWRGPPSGPRGPPNTREQSRGFTPAPY
ncbi:hypothetical protein RhiJN_11740 [Ceratobasidium sp. AG-Ba]|nr:hypothetical protein RhiJN_11740 [Ceratobasidium sp. AG-Ba]